MAQLVADSAAELGILEVVAEALTDDVDGASAFLRTDQWGHSLDLNLLVVSEVAETEFAAVDEDVERH